jgi:hypothetical protein
MDRRVVGCLIGLAPFMGGQRRFRSNCPFWKTQARPLARSAPEVPSLDSLRARRLQR